MKKKKTYKEKLKDLVNKINYYPFSPVENIRFTNSKFIFFEDDNELIKKYKEYFKIIFFDEKEKKNIKLKKKINIQIFLCFVIYILVQI